jgi:hypothetical protein
MTRLTRSSIGAVVALTLLLALPAAAGATRYASPTGDASDTSCPQTDPCDIHTAAEHASVVAGEVIEVAGGNYPITAANPVEPLVSVTIQGAPGTPRARLIGDFTGDGSNDVSVVRLFTNGSVLRDLDVELVENTNNGTYGVFTQADVTIERVGIYVTGTRGSGILLKAGDPFGPTSGTSVLRDSVVRTQSDEFGILIGGVNAPAVANLKVVNVTAVATASPAVALQASDGFGNSSTAIRNGIFASPSLDGDIVADGADGGPNTVEIDVARSNFDGTDASGLDATLTFGAGNQSGAPLFANASGADFRQLPGSPTIDAGAADPFLGSLDFKSKPRSQGPAPDIGADEAPDPGSLLDFGTVGKLKRKRSLSIPANCPLYGCNLAAAANLVVKGAAKPASASRVIKLQNVSATFPAGTQQTLTFKLSKKAFRRLQVAQKARLTVSAAVTVALGFSGTESASFKFKKAKKK